MKRFVTSALAALLAMSALACNKTSTKSSSSGMETSTSAKAQTTTPATSTTPAPAGQEVTMPSGLKYTDVKVGDGDIADDGMTATVHYTGWLLNGTKFDSSLDQGKPFSFKLGAGQVIKGWDEGVKGMRIGGKRHLIIPADMGYGANGAGGVIPPNATLVFDVDLLGLSK